MFWKLLKMFVAGLASVTSLLGLLLYKYQLKLVYPSMLNNGRSQVDKPDKYAIPYEERFLETPDGQKLQTFVMLQDPTCPGYKKKTVLVLCPNAGNIGHALPVCELFYKEMAYNVLVYSYRGYGESTGISTEVGLKIDADTVMKYVMEHPQMGATSLILYGRSLGGAVSIYIGSKNYTQVKGIILENTFLSIRKCIPHIFPFLKTFTFLCHQIWDSEHDITLISPEVNMTFLCATKDEIVPPDHMTKLYELSPSTKKTRHVFEGYHHNDTVIAPNYWNIVHDFIRSIEPLE